MSRQNGRSLRWQLVTLSLGLLLPTLVFVGILLWRFADSERQRAEDQAQGLSRALSVALDREVNGVLTTLQALATSPSLQSRDLPAFYAQAGEIARLQGLNISLRDTNGRTVLTTRAPLGAEVPVPVLLAEADRDVMRTGAPVVSNLFTSATSKKPVFQIIAAPISVAGRRTYMLGASIDVDYLADVIHKEHLPPNWIGAIVDRNGIFAARSERQAESAGRSASADLRAHQALAGGTYYGRNQDGREVLAGFARSELTAWTTAVSLGRHAVNAPLRRSLLILFGLGVSLAALAAAIAYFAARRLSTAFGVLTQAAIEIGQGRQVLAIVTPVAEVNQVGFALQAAGRQLQERARERDQAETRLRILNETLEEQVVERTRERNRWFETTSDLVGTGSFDGDLKAVNPAWTTALGWTEAELMSRPILDIIDPADHPARRAAMGQLSGGESLTGYVDRVRTRAGTSRTIMWTAVPIVEDRLFYMVGRDVTDQRHAEDALRQAQKMEAVGQLTGGIAHDFNNLLAGIMGSLEMMAGRAAQGRFADVERYIGAAQGAAKRAAALTHRLLAFSRRQTLDPKPTDVNRLVSGMEELIRRTVGPSIAMEVVTAVGLWPTMVDPHQLDNALLNLCINARDAMPDGGRLTIETSNRWMDHRAAQERDLAPGQYVSLCVSDSGTGMPPAVIAKAFEPFFTTKPLGAGTGLGLSMIYGFVRQSGGQVRIYSEAGEGTNVCIYLPRHFGDAASPDLPDMRDAPRAAEGETVLVVDDEPTVRMLVTEILEDLGYAALEAVDGAAGLRILESGARIDLLVTDVGLPGGMNGRQMADAARVSRPDLKVLFITGYAENAVFGNGHLEPGMHVVTKPFAMERLATQIKDLISA